MINPPAVFSDPLSSRYLGVTRLTSLTHSAIYLFVMPATNGANGMAHSWTSLPQALETSVAGLNKALNADSWWQAFVDVANRPRVGCYSQARTPQLVGASWRETQLGRNQLDKHSWTSTAGQGPAIRTRQVLDRQGFLLCISICSSPVE